jgi:hypothetical protein
MQPAECAMNLPTKPPLCASPGQFRPICYAANCKAFEENAHNINVSGNICMFCPAMLPCLPGYAATGAASLLPFGRAGNTPQAAG